jgi:hypothetical protein
VDEHLHHELQKGDFQVSKEGDSYVSKGEKGVRGNWQWTLSMGCDVHVLLLVCNYVNESCV